MRLSVTKMSEKPDEKSQKKAKRRLKQSSIHRLPLERGTQRRIFE